MNLHQALADLIKITNKNLGYTPSTPSEFDQLTYKIEQKTRQRISLSSVKRLWGYVNYNGFPSTNTLNNISRFNDFDDWNDYLRRYGDLGIDESSHFLDNNMIESETLNPGDTVSLSWEKDKSCELKYIGNHRYRVMESRNIKLIPGDEFQMHSITIDLPFYAADILRGEERITGYIGAQTSGIKSISLQRGPLRHSPE